MEQTIGHDGWQIDTARGPGALVRWWNSLTTRRAVVASSLVAVLTCLTGLGYQPLSWDEAVTALAAAREPLRLASLLSRTDAPLGAYYAGIHLWTMLLTAVGLNPTEALLRLPTALAAVAAVAATTLFAAQWFGPRHGPRIAFIAGVLLATHPLFVFYAHDARPYTIAVLLTVVATGALVAAVRKPSPARLTAYATFTVLAIYAHLFAGLVVAAHALAVVRHGAHRRRWLVAGAVIVTAVAPLAWLGSHQTGELGWIPQPTPSAVASVLAKIVGGVEAVPLAGLAVLVVATVRARRRPFPTGARVTLVVAWAVLPPVLLVLADFTYPVLVARYALVAVPAMAVGAAAATVWLNTRAAAALLALIVGCAVVTTVHQQAQPFKYEDFRAATDTVGDSSRQGDAVIFLPSAMRVGYDQYARAGLDDRQAPADVALAPGAGPLIADLIGGVELPPDRIQHAIAGHARIFVVGDGPPRTMANHRSPQDRAKVAALRNGYVLAWSHRFGVVTVSLFTSQNLGPAVSGRPLMARQPATMPARDAQRLRPFQVR